MESTSYYERTVEAAGAAPVVEEAVVDEAEALSGYWCSHSPWRRRPCFWRPFSLRTLSSHQGTVACRFGSVIKKGASVVTRWRPVDAELTTVTFPA